MCGLCVGCVRAVCVSVCVCVPGGEGERTYVCDCVYVCICAVYVYVYVYVYVLCVRVCVCVGGRGVFQVSGVWACVFMCVYVSAVPVKATCQPSNCTLVLCTPLHPQKYAPPYNLSCSYVIQHTHPPTHTHPHPHPHRQHTHTHTHTHRQHTHTPVAAPRQ